jgi:uncharacterized phage protein gp47/JayE
MGQFSPRAREFILERMINRTVARTDLTDLNDGSSIKQVLAAAAREDDDAHYQMINMLDLFDIDKAIGLDLDERAKEFNPALISRNAATKATGEVVFSRTGTSGAVTIAIGTQVTVPAVGSQAEIVFTTTEEGTIADTFQNSNSVNIAADKAGVTGNVAVSTITGFVSKPSGVDSVTNAAALTNGTDLESDDDFRTRLKNSIKGLARAHVDGIESAALSAVDPVTSAQVQFAHVVEDVANLGNVTLYIDDGTGSLDDNKTDVADKDVLTAVGGETVFNLPDKPIRTESGFTLKINTVAVPAADYTLNPASGQINLLPAAYPTGLTAADDVDYTGTYWTGLIAETQKVIDGDSGDRVNYPGNRAAGVLVRVLSPSIQQQVVTANITALSGFSQTDVATNVTAAISAYINGLGISDDVILNELRERSMAVAGMYDIEFTAPTTNVVILDTQMARVIDSNITIS